MIVEGKSGKVDSCKFTAIVFTGLYCVFQLISLLNNTAENPDYTAMMRSVIQIQQIGVGICAAVYDCIAIHKYIGYRKKGEIVYFIHPKAEKLLEWLCLTCGIIGFGMACFY